MVGLCRQVAWRSAVVAVCTALTLAACSEQETKEAAPATNAPKPAASAAKQATKPAPAAAPKEVPAQEIAKLDDELGAASERIDKLREDGKSVDSETVDELEAERSKIAKELEELRRAAGEQWQATRDRLAKALEALSERLDRLEKSSAG